jgi:CRP-like cAMP-binding protein
VSPHSELPIPNLFLASLPRDDFEALRPHFEMVRLSLRQILHEMGEPIEHCYFTDGGMTSLLINLEDGASIEAGVVGKEGFAGSAALMGSEDSEPPRDFRRLRLLRGWSHGNPEDSEELLA